MNNSTNLTYNGLVNIKVGNKIHTMHNQGHSNLFTLICRFLAGLSSDLADLPTWIDLRGWNSNPNIKTSQLHAKIRATCSYKQVSIEGDPTPATVITCSLTDTNLIKNATITNFELQLCDNTTYKELATISIDKDIINQIGIGRQAIIEWYLYFKNNTSTETGGSN